MPTEEQKSKFAPIDPATTPSQPLGDLHEDVFVGNDNNRRMSARVLSEKARLEGKSVDELVNEHYSDEHKDQLVEAAEGHLEIPQAQIAFPSEALRGNGSGVIAQEPAGKNYDPSKVNVMGDMKAWAPNSSVTGAKVEQE